MIERSIVQKVIYDNVIFAFKGINNAFESQRLIADSIGVQLGKQRQEALISLGACWGVIDIPDKKNTFQIGFRCPLESQSQVRSIIDDAGFQVCRTCKKVDSETSAETMHLYIS